MARKPRDYSREYQRRNELAQQRGFKSYGQQRRYVEYTATPVRYLGQVSPGDIAETYISSPYDYNRYTWDDDLLNAWIIRLEHRGISNEEAFNLYKKRAHGGSLSRAQIGRLSRDLYGEEWGEKWSTS